MKFLIAGLGSIGRRHLRNLVALGQEDILLYRTHQSTLPDDMLDPYPVETDLDAALAHKPDAVIVANPTALHLQVAIPAARNGCHLLLEKPVAETLNDDVQTLVRVAADSGVRTLVGFQFRFHPVLSKIKDILDSGEMGRPYSFRIHWGEYLPAWHPWEDYRESYAARKDLGGGVVNTLSHPIDYARWLFGEAESISAVTGQFSDLEMDVEDAAEISMKFANGCLGSVHLDYFQRPPAHWLAINCKYGHIRWDNDTGVAKVFRAEKEEWYVIEPPKAFERNHLFQDEMRHFIALVMGTVPSQCSLNDGIRALELTQAVHESARTGCGISV